MPYPPTIGESMDGQAAEETTGRRPLDAVHQPAAGMIALVAHITSRIMAVALALAFVVAGCTVFDADPSRATLAELFAGSYDPQRIEGVDLDAFGLSPVEPGTFCEAAATTPLRWTVDALVPMQVWLDTYASVIEMPEAVVPSAAHLIDLTTRRLRWSLTGEGERPVWTAETIAAAETVIDVALATCPDLPIVVGRPEQSQRPPGWADMSDLEVTAHCDSMADRLAQGVAEHEADRGREPRHHMELDLPIAYYGTSDFHGITVDADGGARVVPVPGGACDSNGPPDTT